MGGEGTALYLLDAGYSVILMLVEGGLVTLGQHVSKCASSVTENTGYDCHYNFRGERSSGAGPRG